MYSDIYSLELETHLLAGLLKHPSTFAEIDGYIDEHDFTTKLHKAIFSTIRSTLRSKEEVDKRLIADKIERIAIAFEDKISSVFDYLNNMTLIQINSKNVPHVAEELKLYSIKRMLSGTGKELDQLAHNNSIRDHKELITRSDEIYNRQLSLWNLSNEAPENIFADIEKVLDHRAKNPQDNIGYMGPHILTNEIYGSLLRPSNITTICSRAGQGKSTFMNDYCFKVAEHYNKLPILYFDNGEMPKEETQMRQVAALTGIDFYLIETGKYAKDPELEKKVKEMFKRVRDVKFYYYNVAGQTVDEMLSLMRRFYMSQIGRDKPMIFCFDYIKSTSEITSLTKAEWETIGHMVTKFKDFIMKEVKIPMMTAVQANRIGIHTNKESKFVIDDESVFSGGDRTVFFSSHAFILRKKTYDEQQTENEQWGTHKLINVKARHLGKQARRATRLVAMPNGQKRNNYINLNIDNFAVEEKGDLVAMQQSIGHLDIAKHDVSEEVGFE